jgi:8-oxo-dGTP diphosphatase
MSHSYEHPRPALAVDCVVFGLDENGLQVLLVERGVAPFKGRTALPGGFVHLDETLEQAARRELEEETGLGAKVFLEQLYTFGELHRDPRERVVTVAYYALVKLSDHRVRAATDASAAAWFRLSDKPQLAFDHEQILRVAKARLQAKVRYQPLGFELLPPRFTLAQLQSLYEAVLEKPVDKRNFRKKILSMELLEETGEREEGVSHRAARLYRFDRKRYVALEKAGFNFEL